MPDFVFRDADTGRPGTPLGTTPGTNPSAIDQRPGGGAGRGGGGGVVDELQAWYLARANAEGWVYTAIVRQLLNRMYRERDYLARRKAQGQRTAYDYAVERDQKALAWAVRALVDYVPAEEKVRPEPPKKARTPRRRLSPEERERYKGKPSWNGQPKRGWGGIELPPSQ